jgi:dTDP-4-amino-4,6-dideoxygalactose transaminase
MPAPTSTSQFGSATIQGVAPLPAFNLTRQYQSIRNEVREAIDRVLTTQHFIGGSEVESFETEVAKYLGVAACIACASGTDALWLGLQALEIRPGDSVLTTPFSFFASASSITRRGATPVFADIDPATLNLRPDSVEAAIKRDGKGKIKAVVPVHLFGQCADMDTLLGLSNEAGVPLLEDAAQAFGAKWGAKMAGSWGTAAAFSFYPTKNLGAYGDGGCVTTDNPEMAAHLRRLRNHGSRERYYHEDIGWNSRLDALQAALLRVKLPHLDDWNGQRRYLAQRYDSLLHQAGLTEAGKLTPNDAAPIAPIRARAEAFHIFHQYVVRGLRRDDLRSSLAQQGIGTEIYYPLPLHLQQAFANLGYGRGDFPEAERAAAEVLALPMFPELREDEQQRVVAAIADFYS